MRASIQLNSKQQRQLQVELPTLTRALLSAFSGERLKGESDVEMQGCCCCDSPGSGVPRPARDSKCELKLLGCVWVWKGSRQMEEWRGLSLQDTPSHPPFPHPTASASHYRLVLIAGWMSTRRRNILREYDFLQVHEVQLDSDVNFYELSL